jgi:hypothetical protein
MRWINWGLLSSHWRLEASVCIGRAASEALRLGYPTLLVSSCGLRPHSPFTSLREIPQAQCLTRGLLATVKISARNSHYFKAAKYAEVGTSLAHTGL